MSERPARLPRDAFRIIRPIARRWMDNGVCGHVNNVHDGSYFDTSTAGFRAMPC
jgi:hypothetical protein